MGNGIEIIRIGMQALACVLLFTAFISILLRKPSPENPYGPLVIWLLLLLFAHAGFLWNRLHHLAAIASYVYPMSVLEWLLHGWLLRTLLPSPQQRYLDYLLIASLSVSITLYATLPSEVRFEEALVSVHSGLILLLAVRILAIQSTKKQLNVLQSPLFWVAIGTFFYHSMYLVIQWIAPLTSYAIKTPDETEILLLFFSLIRYMHYIIGGWVKEATD